MTEVPIMANDHQDLLEATLICENAKSVMQNHKACASGMSSQTRVAVSRVAYQRQ